MKEICKMGIKYLLIGGGRIQDDETIEIDRFLLEMYNTKPNVLYIPAKKRDDDVFEEYYTKVGFNVLSIDFDKDYTLNEINELMNEIDIVYLGGGNPVDLMNVLKRSKIDRYILNNENSEKELVIAGMSAGIMVLGNKFNISMGTINVKENEIEYYDGLNIFDNVIFEPHFAAMNRIGHLSNDVKSIKFGIGVDNNTAIYYSDEIFNVIGKGYVLLLTRQEEKMVLKLFSYKDSFKL